MTIGRILDVYAFALRHTTQLACHKTGFGFPSPDWLPGWIMNSQVASAQTVPRIYEHIRLGYTSCVYTVRCTYKPCSTSSTYHSHSNRMQVNPVEVGGHPRPIPPRLSYT